VIEERASLVDRVVADISAQIRAGDLRPAERLPSERRLCGLFGVSRTTVREALKALATQGYVVQSRRGAVVVEPGPTPQLEVDLEALAAQATIRDLYEVRKLFEVQVARWVAIRATPSDLERLRRSVEAEHLDGDDGANPNTAFHDALVAAAHNPVLAQVQAASYDLFHHLPFYWRLFESTEVRSVREWRHELARRWHRQILQALEQRDPDEAGGAMFQHLDVMEKDLLARLRLLGGNEGPPHPILDDLLHGPDEQASAAALVAPRPAPSARGRGDA
jgi:GntR family transcriptional repressor for pyruvate dehydrogenase complex